MYGVLKSAPDGRHRPPAHSPAQSIHHKPHPTPNPPPLRHHPPPSTYHPTNPVDRAALRPSYLSEQTVPQPPPFPHRASGPPLVRHFHITAPQPGTSRAQPVYSTQPMQYVPLPSPNQRERQRSLKNRPIGPPPLLPVRPAQHQPDYRESRELREDRRDGREARDTRVHKPKNTDALELLVSAAATLAPSPPKRTQAAPSSFNNSSPVHVVSPSNRRLASIADLTRGAQDLTSGFWRSSFGASVTENLGMSLPTMTMGSLVAQETNRPILKRPDSGDDSYSPTGSLSGGEASAKLRRKYVFGEIPDSPENPTFPPLAIHPFRRPSPSPTSQPPSRDSQPSTRTSLTSSTSTLLTPTTDQWPPTGPFEKAALTDYPSTKSLCEIPNHPVVEALFPRMRRSTSDDDPAARGHVARSESIHSARSIAMSVRSVQSAPARTGTGPAYLSSKVLCPPAPSWRTSLFETSSRPSHISTKRNHSDLDEKTSPTINSVRIGGIPLRLVKSEGASVSPSLSIFSTNSASTADERPAKRPKSGLRRWPKRTGSRRKEQNAVAQKRFREKKKTTAARNVMELDLTRGKLMDMERRLYSIEAELLKKNETIRALESKNADLQNELEDCGKGKQAQVEERLEYPPGRV